MAKPAVTLLWCSQVWIKNTNQTDQEYNWLQIKYIFPVYSLKCPPKVKPKLKSAVWNKKWNPNIRKKYQVKNQTNSVNLITVMRGPKDQINFHKDKIVMAGQQGQSISRLVGLLGFPRMQWLDTTKSSH